MRNFSILACLALALVLLGGNGALGTVYRPVALQWLHPIANGGSAAFDINDSNEIVGYFDRSSGRAGCRWDPNSVPHELQSGAYDANFTAFRINDAGAVVGYSDNYALGWSQGGVISQLQTPSGSRSKAYGINSSGTLVGAIDLNQATNRGGWWDASGWHELEGASGLCDINDAGTTLGVSGGKVGIWDSTGFHEYGSGSPWRLNESNTAVGYEGSWACKWDASGKTSLPKLSGTWTSSQAFGINDSGVIVGRHLNGHVTLGQACYWDASGVHELAPPPGAHASGAYGINTNGWIVGYGTYPGEALRPVLWVPVPEPASLLVLLTGCSLLRVRKRER